VGRKEDAAGTKSVPPDAAKETILCRDAILRRKEVENEESA
jgi:hypothetical protein